MVLKVTHKTDMARRSAPSKKSKKKMKQEYQGKRKDNYKKKKASSKVFVSHLKSKDAPMPRCW